MEKKKEQKKIPQKEKKKPSQGERKTGTKKKTYNHKKRNGKARSNKTALRKKQLARRAVLAGAAAVILAVLGFLLFFRKSDKEENHTLSDNVLQHETLVDQYVKEYGIEEYKDYILAIIQVESAGIGEDIMQSSESLGLSPNSLGKEESVRQGCAYFSTLVSYGKSLGCDMESVVQAYNYGMGFLDFVAQNGKAYSFELASQYASQMSGGNTVAYTNPLAFEVNGGWRYTYGNMFYVMLVEQYLT